MANARYSSPGTNFKGNTNLDKLNKLSDKLNVINVS